MAAKLAIIFVAGLALAPAVTTLASGPRTQESADRRVELHGPIFEFTQTHDRVQVRLSPARDDADRLGRTRLVVQAAGGDPDGGVAVPIRKGQTWLSADLPDTLARADLLVVSVE